MLYQVIQVGKFFASFLFTTKTKTTMTPHELMWQKGNLLYALIFVPSFFFDTQRADMSFFFAKKSYGMFCSIHIVLNQEDLFAIGDDELDKLKNSEIALEWHS